MLVDDSTTDKTEEVARKAGCKVARRKFDDYARQRQAALEMCTKDWVLWIDADERTTPEFRRGVDALFAEGKFIESSFDDGYEVPFVVRFLGHEMKFGGLGSESHVRLFQRKRARFIGGALHEGIELTDGPAEFYVNMGPLLHEPYRDVPDYLSKLDRYTTLSAEKKFAAGKRFRPWHHLIGPWEFFMRAVLKLGFLDGKAGLTWAWLSARHSALKYAKLKELESRK